MDAILWEGCEDEAQTNVGCVLKTRSDLSVSGVLIHAAGRKGGNM